MIALDTAAIDAVIALHHPWADSEEACERGEIYCAVCVRPVTAELVLWPCPTLRVIDEVWA